MHRTVYVTPSKARLDAAKVKLTTQRFKEGLKVGVLIQDVSRMRTVIIDQAVGHFEMTRSQWWILVNVVKKGTEGVSQTELARTLFLGSAGVSAIVSRLIQKRLLDTGADAKDRRIKKIYITEKGRELVENMLPIAVQCNDDFLAGMSLADLKLANTLLKQMKQQLLEVLSETHSKG